MDLGKNLRSISISSRMIDFETNKQLRDQYSPEGSTLRRAQERLLEMMVYLDRICRKHNITYWLDSGTLLGAVRHGGFIPWDDDVDVCIEKKDARRLKKAIKEDPHPDFVMQDRSTDKNHWREWFTIRDLKTEYVQDSVFHNQQRFKGLQVDVFLMERNVNHRLWRFSVKLYNFKLLLVKKGHHKLGVFVHHFNEYIVFPILRFLAYFGSDHKREMHKVYGQVFDHYFPVNSILPVKELSFDGYSFFAPADSDSYLRESFGSGYMSIPSKDLLEQFDHKVNIVFKD